MTQKTVLITGCSSGIGRLAAQTFQANGWNVIATMRTPEKETELNKLDNLLVARLDVTDSVSVEAAVANGIERFGEIDVLVNNAGRGGRALLEQMSDEKIRDVFETNLFGAMRVTRAILPHMRKRGDGCVINVTSMAGVIGLAAETAYCSAKFAAEGFTESLYWECKPLGIKVKSVALVFIGRRLLAKMLMTRRWKKAMSSLLLMLDDCASILAIQQMPQAVRRRPTRKKWRIEFLSVLHKTRHYTIQSAQMLT